MYLVLSQGAFMNNKLYVSNLPFSMRDGDLLETFSKHGAVVSAKVIMDRFSGRSKGFGFVEVNSEEDAQRMIEILNGQDVSGRLIRVMISKPKEDDKEMK